MIQNLVIYKDGSFKENMEETFIGNDEIAWFWIHFENPTETENQWLIDTFKFHPLAIDDCFNYIQRPKMDYYDGYQFFAFQEIERKTMRQQEVDVFLSPQYLITYTKHQSHAIRNAYNKIKQKKEYLLKGPDYFLYAINDEIVDDFFPFANEMEDEIEEINETAAERSHKIVDQVYDIRTKLIKLRKTVRPMCELMYRIINSTHVHVSADTKLHFHDIYDHLTKVSEMIEDNREMANDIRENYLSTNAHKMNQIMKTLTAISIIFMPLTFIVGVYGMNFDILPELHWKYGYLLIWFIMIDITGGMLYLFKKKEWF